MAILEVNNIGVSVKNLELVATFFKDKVGVPVVLGLDDGYRYAHVFLGKHKMLLYESISKAQFIKREMYIVNNPAGVDHIALVCDDIEKTYNEMRNRGVEFFGELQTFPQWRVRMIGFKDPEDNWYYLMQENV